MPVPVAVPKLGNHMRAGLVAEWYEPDGAAVHAGDAVCRLEYENVAVEIEAEADGVLRHRLPDGLVRPPGDVLGVVLAPGERVPAFEPVEPLPIDVEIEAAARAVTDAVEEASLVGAPENNASVETQALKRGDEPAEPMEECAGAPVVPEPGEGWKRASPVPLALRRSIQRDAHAFMAEPWDAVPGGSADFSSALLSVPRDSTLEPHVEPQAPADHEPESKEFADWLRAEPENPPSAPQPEAPVSDWSAWIAGEAPGESPARFAASMAVTVDLREAHKMCEQLAREWRACGIVPVFEDVALRAIARALAGSEVAPAEVALRTFDGEERVRVLAGAATRPFRDAVGALASMAPGGAAECIVTTYAAEGIENAVPSLAGEQWIAIALGCPHVIVAWEDERCVARSVASITVAYRPERIADGQAAGVLGRIRDLIESPYALLAD